MHSMTLSSAHVTICEDLRSDDRPFHPETSFADVITNEGILNVSASMMQLASVTYCFV